MADNVLLQTLRLNYIYSEKYAFPKGWSYYESSIPYSMIRYIEKGKASFTIDDTLYQLEADDIIYIPEGCRLECEALTDDFTFISIRFSAAFSLSDSDFWSSIMGYDTKIKCTDPLIKQFFDSIIQEKDSSKRGKFLLLRGYLEIILGYVINSSDTAFNRADKPKPIKQDSSNNGNRAQIVVDYMIHHFDKSISIEEMSKMANMSSATLRRLFKQHTGKSPSEFLIELKMTVAARKILETDERISDIAYMVGIEDPNYFSRVFKKHYGATPHSYRQLARD